MANKEKFGKFLLFEAIESFGVGGEYRAAKLGAAGLEKIVSLLRVAPAVSGNAEVAKALMEQAKFAAQLQSPNIVKILGIGKVDASYYISSEFVEGKSLRAVFSRCRQDGFPFSVDHALLIASKICSALEYAHSRKIDGTTRYFHGLLTPGAVVLSYEGEVRVRGFGHWLSRVQDTGALSPEDRLYLAPEQDAGGRGDTRSDTFAVGALLFETLTGKPLFQGGRGVDPAALVAGARLQSPTSDDDSLPKPIDGILKRALATDPAGRYAEILEMRKAIDTLLFSGDFTPTTFNLAFFMHSLFRDDIERESRLLKEEREASHADVVGEDNARTRPGAAVAPPAAQADAHTLRLESAPIESAVTLTQPPLALPGPKSTASPAPPGPSPPPLASPASSEPSPTPLASPASSEPSPTPLASHPSPTPAAKPTPAAAHSPTPPPASHQTSPPLAPTPQEPASGFTFEKEAPKSRALVVVGIALLALTGAAGGYYLMKRAAVSPSASVATPPSPTAEVQAAMARVKELEQKLAALEAERQAAEEQAAQEARKKLEAQAKSKGQALDPAALARTQEEERRRARAEQERRQQEEQRRLEEAKKAEELRLEQERLRAQEQRQAEEAARAAAAATTTTLPPTTTTSLPPTTTTPPEPAVVPGQLMNLSDAGVIAPIAERKPSLAYPPLALRQKVEGTVELNVLVDETGKVTDAQVVTGAGGKMGLNEAALDNVKRWRFRAATKDGVPVKVWLPVKVDFKLPD